MTFGEKFKAEREKRKLTQQEVADALGINRRMITRYENGISFPRTKDAYRKIAEYFKVDVNYLLTEDEEFVVQASEQYGSRGMKQAKDLIEGMSGLFAGGTLSEQAMPFFRQSARLYRSAWPISLPQVMTNHACFAPRSSVFRSQSRTTRGMRHA